MLISTLSFFKWFLPMPFLASLLILLGSNSSFQSHWCCWWWCLLFYCQYFFYTLYFQLLYLICFFFLTWFLVVHQSFSFILLLVFLPKNPATTFDIFFHYSTVLLFPYIFSSVHFFSLVLPEVLLYLLWYAALFFLNFDVAFCCVFKTQFRSKECLNNMVRG